MCVCGKPMRSIEKITNRRFMKIFMFFFMFIFGIDKWVNVCDVSSFFYYIHFCAHYTSLLSPENVGKEN